MAKSGQVRRREWSKSRGHSLQGQSLPDGCWPSVGAFASMPSSPKAVVSGLPQPENG